MKDDVMTKEQAVGFINQMELLLDDKDLCGLRDFKEKTIGLIATIEFLKLAFKLNEKEVKNEV